MKIKIVSNNIKDLRYHHNQLSQEDLATLVNCTRQTISAIEKNRYSPSYVLVCKIAKVFNVPVEDVIKIEFE